MSNNSINGATLAEMILGFLSDTIKNAEVPKEEPQPTQSAGRFLYTFEVQHRGQSRIVTRIPTKLTFRADSKEEALAWATLAYEPKENQHLVLVSVQN